MPCRGIRGATTVAEDRAEAILAATRELLEALAAANGLRPADVGSVLFTVTPDLCAAFPARAAREMGWTGVPLLDAAEMAAPGSLPRCIRVLIHWNTELPPEAIRHIYLHDAACLRPDLAADAPVFAAVAAADAAVRPTSLFPTDLSGAKPMTTVAYQGEPGAYSQEAIFQHFGPETETLPCHSFDEIFAALETGKADMGLLPIENSTAGSITTAYDLLLEHDLRVVGEVKLRVRHCLLALAGTQPADIQRVYSHPQALAQCERYLKSRGWEPVPAYDTAGSAKELAERQEPGAASIASALAGQIYGLEVLDRGVEDAHDNTTRFFLLGGGEPPRAANSKTSLVFATTHNPGALYRALGEFATRGINLTKIESRPRHNRPWHYVFYVDLEGHWQDPDIAQALVSLLVRSAYVKLLGSYPAASDPQD
jgi:prephenate dehydratase